MVCKPLSCRLGYVGCLERTVQLETELGNADLIHAM